MKQGNDFMVDLLDLDAPEAAGDVIWRACRPTGARVVDGDAWFTVPFQAQKRGLLVEVDPQVPRKEVQLRVRAYGDQIVRLSIAFDGELPGENSPMLELHPSLAVEPLSVRETVAGWEVTDRAGEVRFRVNTTPPQTVHWSDLLPPPEETLDAIAFPDSGTSVPLMAYDQFFPRKHESMALAYVEREGAPHRAVYSLYAAPGEAFAGTGERFAKMSLAGRTLVLENVDSLGVNSRRAYKNIPFYVSSRPYGLFLHTSAHVRLSLADISTRAAQGLVEEPVLDLFVIGGGSSTGSGRGSIERVLYNYRRLTGFPQDVPMWSYGTWMSRMTYFSADEVRTVARKLREGGFPCDVLHLDTGWFAKDWICEWEFSQERFPDPEGFMREMREQGYRITLWQTPEIGEGNKLLEMARRKRYLAPPRPGREIAGRDTAMQDISGQIDFTNPEAVAWYQGMLERMLRMGASAIKTDFGENVDPDGDYYGMPAEKLHNLYPLLYQRAAYEVTRRTTGEGLVWARSGWAGCQRYPVHWGGDAACSWDGLAGSIRGGLHLGLSGFGFWSHDVPGFHGVPDFMNSRPADDLYVRWTQVGVFTSHLRYHGACPREPYEYPAVADIVRQWLRLRYALIPYLVEQGRKATETGLPMLRALVFHHADDPTCWHIDDQYYLGDAFLVAPIMNSEGVRDVYLPEGEWVDLWTGERFAGSRWLKGVRVPLERMPVYFKYGAQIAAYPHLVQSTDGMDLAKSVTLVIDDGYRGFSGSILGSIVGL
jgi:alpha-D-xyloside xylohydrolase